MSQVYRLDDVPRSITWDEVRRMLDVVERRRVRGTAGLRHLASCEIPEVDATGLPGNTRTWCDWVPEPDATKSQIDQKW
jgi:hypothetical protein